MVSPPHPNWLVTLLADTKPPPKLFAWCPENISPLSGGGFVKASGSEYGNHAAADPNDSTPDSDDRIFIVGPGNIGRLYASYMSRHTDALPITLVVHRKELLSQWLTCDGVVLADRDGGRMLKSKRFNIEWWTEAKPQYGPVREVANGGTLGKVFISTKADAGLAEVDRFRRYLGRLSSVVFAQNGVSKLWPPYGPLYLAHRYDFNDTPTFSACVVNHGVSSAGPFLSIHAAPADASIGPILYSSGPPLPYEGHTKKKKAKWKWGSSFSHYISTTPHLDTKLVCAGELWLIQLEKLVTNATINPLTALLRCKTGELFTSYASEDSLARVLDKLLWQASAVIQALINHHASLDIVTSYAETVQRLIPGADDYYKNFANIRRKLTVRFSQPVLKAKMYAFGRKISEHRSSMLQDVEAGRRTEIQDLNGWIVDMADFLGTGLDVSVHCGLIELIESGRVLDKRELARELL
ncbi:hypothetical protein LMH87_000654 [Akanthomyces muscarius]|uniref:Ketoisovalerate reductase n=1 Tax=Akanthomyces muscarius TaxID=2231603 RepID=A0A9W8QFS5_AKAMU|nr:hypothetical protein LMH87_000654 [Akanthomyces muscarius]KAJ4155411.1 hypothetical protein LMH87_000654 [Akanthomyces muscarius]